MNHLPRLALLVVCICFAAAVFAQRAGSLDTTFNHTGKVYNTIAGDTANAGIAMAIQSDGKIVVTGYTESITDNTSRCAVVRYNTDGSIDTTFNKTGYVVANIDSTKSLSFCSVVIQPNGKILALGSENNYNFVLVRLNVNGTLDTTFGSKGIALTSVNGEATSLVLQSDSKIVAGGFGVGLDVPPFELVRCDSTGKIDSTFGTDGIVDTFLTSTYYSEAFPHALAIQSDGKIVAAGFTIPTYFDTLGNIYYGSFSVLARFNTDGSFDTTFGIGGTDTQHIVGTLNAVAIQTDGKIVVSGNLGLSLHYTLSYFAVVRYNSNGSQDKNFGNNGIEIDSMASSGVAASLVLQADGKIVAAGYGLPGGWGLSRFNTNGTRDTLFGIGGNVSTDIIPGNPEDAAESVALQSDGKIVVAGFVTNNEANGIYFALARYNNYISTGILHLSSTPTSILIYPNPVHNTETLDYTLTNTETLTINLYDVTGRVIRNYMTGEKILSGEHKQQLNFDNLAAGSYILTISNAEGKTESVKIIRQ